MQRIVDTNKVTFPHKKLTSLRRIFLQTPIQLQQKMMIIKWLMSTIGNIVDMVRLDLEFVEESPKTGSWKRVVRLFCVCILEGS